MQWAQYFYSEEAAYAELETLVWPNGPVCPRCGGAARIGKLQSAGVRIGIHKCYDCGMQFRVTAGTAMKSSHVRLNQWLQAIYLMAARKEGYTSREMAEAIGVTQKTAWFIIHRLREATARPGNSRATGFKVAEIAESLLSKKR